MFNIQHQLYTRIKYGVRTLPGDRISNYLQYFFIQVCIVFWVFRKLSVGSWCTCRILAICRHCSSSVVVDLFSRSPRELEANRKLNSTDVLYLWNACELGHMSCSVSVSFYEWGIHWESNQISLSYLLETVLASLPLNCKFWATLYEMSDTACVVLRDCVVKNYHDSFSCNSSMRYPILIICGKNRAVTRLIFVIALIARLVILIVH